mgnify:CR=1 FL=1
MRRRPSLICPACGAVASAHSTTVGGGAICGRCQKTGKRSDFLQHLSRPQAPADWDGRAHVNGRVLAPGINDGALDDGSW